MPIPTADRWLWLGLSVSLLIAVIGVRRSVQNALQDLQTIDRQDDEVRESSKPQISQSISLSTLRVLTKSPNVNIKEAAIDLIEQRLSEPVHYQRVMALIDKDAKSDDDQLKLQASIARAQLLRLKQNDSFEARIDERSGLLTPTEESASFADTTWPSTPEGLSEVAIALPPAIPRERRTDSADVETRRRRREAVVLHEGSGEIIESDIIRPGHVQHAHGRDD